MKIKDITVRPPVTAPAETTIQGAARLMASEAVGSLIIADGKTLIGIVTDRDLVVRAVARGLPPDTRVDDIMSMNVISLDVETDVREAIRAFGSHAVRRLPIVQNGKLVGLLSLDDLIVALAGQFAEVTQGLTAQLLFPHAFDEPSHPAPVD